jgi:hypothetical protein
MTNHVFALVLKLAIEWRKGAAGKSLGVARGDERDPAIIRRLSQSRAVALDMESATIAANGFRFRVPYGTLLCVSFMPSARRFPPPWSVEKLPECFIVRDGQ